MKVIPGSKAEKMGITFSPNWTMIDLQRNHGESGEWETVCKDPAKCTNGRIS